MKLIKHTSIVPFRPDDVQKKLTHMMRDVNIRSNGTSGLRPHVLHVDLYSTYARVNFGCVAASSPSLGGGCFNAEDSDIFPTCC